MAHPWGVTFDPAGNVVIADTNNDRIHVVAAADGIFYGQKMKAGYIYTVAGGGSPSFCGSTGGRARAPGAWISRRL